MARDARHRVLTALEPVADHHPGLAAVLRDLAAADAMPSDFVRRVAALDLWHALRSTEALPIAAVHRTLVGAGFAATLRFAYLPRDERGRTLLIAADDEPWLGRGTLPMGQRVDELACPALPIDVVDLTPASALHQFCPAETFGVALRLSQLSLGMKFHRATLEDAELDESGDTLLHLLPSVASVRTKVLELALGAGPPRRMHEAIVPDHDPMRAAGTLLYAEEAMLETVTLPPRVAIGSAGLSAAWVAEKALRRGCTEVWLLGSGHARWPGDPTQAAAESREQFELVQRTPRTRFLLGAPPPSGAQAARLTLEPDGAVRVEYRTFGYRKVHGVGAVARVELDDGTRLEVDCFVSALGQDDRWKRSEPTALDARPPVAALGLSRWRPTPARDGARVGVTDADERHRVLGAAGTRRASGLARERKKTDRSPSTRDTEELLRALIQRGHVTPNAETPDGVPYQSWAVSAHLPTRRGVLAPDGLALANLGSAAALRAALGDDRDADDVLAARERLRRSRAAGTPEERHTAALGALPLLPTWWTLEDFARAGLDRRIVERLLAFDPPRDLGSWIA